MGLLFTPARNKYVVLGEERGEARGEERGIALGEARAVARFADWFARKEQAEKEGRDFNEPPPFLDSNGSTGKDNSQR